MYFRDVMDSQSIEHQSECLIEIVHNQHGVWNIPVHLASFCSPFYLSHMLPIWFSPPEISFKVTHSSHRPHVSFQEPRDTWLDKWISYDLFLLCDAGCKFDKCPSYPWGILTLWLSPLCFCWGKAFSTSELPRVDWTWKLISRRLSTCLCVHCNCILTE